MLSLQHHRPLAPIDSLGIAHLDSLESLDFGSNVLLHFG